MLLLLAPQKPQTLIDATIEVDSLFIEENISQKNENSTILETEKVIKNEQEALEKIVKKPNHQKENKENLASQNNQQKNQESEKKVMVLYGPLPKIPEHLKNEVFQTYAMARFYIKKDGTAKVELLKPSNNPELNYLLLKNLSKWQFETSDKESVQDIKVNFKVENETY